MKISICDICKLKDKKIVESVYRRGFTNHVKIDVCENHKEYDMGKTPQEFSTKYFELLNGGPIFPTVEVPPAPEPSK